LKKTGLYSKVFLIILFIIVQIYCWLRFGVSLHQDSENYIKYSQHLTQHFSFPYPRLFWYTSYAVFLSFFKFLSLSLSWVIAAQIFISAITAYALYQLTLTISGKKLEAFVACFLFISCLKIQWWNNYILTESLFINSNILFFYLLTKYKHLSIQSFLLIPFLVFIFFIRPTGIITIISFGCYLLCLLWKNQYKLKWIYYLCILTIAVIIIPLTDLMSSNFNIIEPLKNQHIICGISDIMVGDNKPSPQQKSALSQFIFYTLHNPVSFLKISMQKMFYFWSTYRPGYSNLHNAVSLFYFAPIYLFALLALFRAKIAIATKVYSLTFIGLNCLLVLATCVNWDSRFLAPLLPFIFILAGIGFGTFLDLLKDL